MKHILLIFLLALSSSGFAQQIGTSQIKNDAITEPKLAPNALRPVSYGTLGSGALTFDEAQKNYTVTIGSDLALTLSGSTQTAFSRIYIEATGDGTHVLSFPTNWDITGTFSPNSINFIELLFTGSTHVVGSIHNVEDIIEVVLTNAIVDAATPSQVMLTFDNAVTITTSGWTLEADGIPVNLISVSGSGTIAPTFTTVRALQAGEVLTISYDPATGATTSLTGNELETITDQAVTGIPAVPVGVVFDVYVSAAAADDIAAGTIGDPYKTIQAGVNAATSGQIVGVRTGTYRETITGKTGVSVYAYTGETAIVNAFNLVATSWTSHDLTGGKSIYKTTISLPVTGFNTSTTQTLYPTAIYANQIIRNGVMQPEARYPNVGINGTVGTDDYLDRTKYRNGINYTNGFNTTSLTDASFPIAANGLVNATLISNGWFMQESRTITTHSSNTIGWSSPIWDNTATGQWARYRFFIMGKLGLLDAAGEWFYDGTTLYFWQVGGGTITGTVEYKARNWGFDLRDKQNVTIKGLTFIGCDAMVGNANSTGITIDGITSTLANHYVRHDVNEWQGVGMAKQFGIKLLGANSVIKNSTIAYSAGTSVWLGPNCRAENNTIHDIGYAGYWGNAISLWGTDDNQVITRNTIYRTGRSSFDFGFNFGVAPGTSHHYNVEVSYNDFSEAALISSDAGATYSWGQCDLFGLNYHHNWIHDIKAREQVDGGLNCGIYFDQSTGGGKIHHNVTWSCADVDMYHEPANNYRPAQGSWTHPSATMDLYNNTFATSDGTNLGSYRTYKPSPFDKQRNNIYTHSIVSSYGNDVSNSVLPGTNAQFVATGADGLYYRPGVTSPAIGLGLATFTGITGPVTDGSTTAGAYIYNDPDPWIPGAQAVVDDVTGTVNDNNSSITYSSSEWTYFPSFKPTFTGGDAHITSVVGATASYVFLSGTEVSVTAEKCDNMGVIRVQIFDDTSVNGVFTNQIGSNVDVDLYKNTGGTAQNVCPNGERAVVFNVAGLVAGDKMVKITFLTADNTATPQRANVVFDNFIIE